MAIDKQTQALLDIEKASGMPPIYMFPYKQARQMVLDAFVLKSIPISVGKVEDIVIPCSWGKMKARIYSPNGKGPFPIVVYFHGGGWVFGSIETHDSVCRHIANISESIVISIEYRLSPESKFPGPVEDAYSAVEWVYDNADRYNGISDKLAVAGDSAGGNMSAVVSVLSRDRNGPPIKLQVLIYPVTDYVFPGTKSYTEKGEGFSLERNAMIWFWNHYLNSDEDINNPYICPLRNKNHQGLPPAIIITAEHDPLRDEGEMYAVKLKEAGVAVNHKRYDGLIHGFILEWNKIDLAMEALEYISKQIRERFQLV